MTTCPKCHYTRKAGDSHVHQGICPSCGIAYAKYRAPETEDNTTLESIEEEYGEETISFWTRLSNTLTYVPEKPDMTLFWGRALLFAVFVLWGLSFIFGGIDWQKIGGSFMHNVNLPFHEFGHVLFGFLGRFMGILGGSLFQVLFPLVFVFAFSFQMRDNFAASICLWWCGQSFIDVSPYIADAPHRALPLILGMSEDYHDWGNILTMTHAMDKAQTLANTSFTLGTLIMLLSFLWGGWILWLQYQTQRE